jgi:hypothetical protein
MAQPHILEEANSVINAETIHKMKFCKLNFNKLQELAISQMAEITSLIEQFNDIQKDRERIINLNSKQQIKSVNLAKLIVLKDKKIKILKKKVKYLKFKQTIKLTADDLIT